MNRFKVGGGRMKPADYIISRQAVIVPAGTTLEDVLQPTAWQNYNTQLTVDTHVIVKSECKELYVELEVRGVDNLRTDMEVLAVYRAPDADFDGDVDNSVDGVTIKWGGPNGKWRVIGPDNEVIESGIDSKEAAEARMKEIAAG